MTIRVHIGAHKTATTEMQQAFRRMRARFAESRMAVVGPKGLRGDWVSLHRALFTDDTEARARAKTRFGRWLRRHDNHVISEENIIGGIHRRRIFGGNNQLYPDAAVNIGLLRELLGNPEIELFLSIRDPAEFVTSAYGQVLREGVAQDIEDYTVGYDVAALSWADLVERLRDCEGVSRVICWRYEDYAQLRPEVMTMLFGPELAALVPPAERHNAGYSQAAYDQFIEWVMDDVDEPFVELLKRARDMYPKLPGDPGMRLFPPETYERSREFYAKDVARLSRIPGATLLWPAGEDPADLPA
ncbi:hypothetical protein [Paracoccus albus]|uniref:hypothetical protein n=1 Tax=Paracoccus albus TaxID=3017784 RepID=UPI0022F05123|nr:hypothetical protein [Paracoccus albus]WBU60768.1 hypothetical protein PAF20_02250 [Paracoccus albus]